MPMNMSSVFCAKFCMIACVLAAAVLLCPMNFNASFHKDVPPPAPGWVLVTDPAFGYDAEFFKTRNLVVALVDQGSSSPRYSIDRLESADGKLTAHVTRTSGMIQTMDFVSWVMLLEIDKSITVDDVQIILSSKITDSAT